jgi:predicted transcriptional regulator YdeE
VGFINVRRSIPMIGPKIIETGPIHLIGCSFYGNPFVQIGEWDEDNEIGLLWKRFLALYQADPDTFATIRTDDSWIELHLEGPESASRGLFEVFVGLPVKPDSDIPLNCVAKTLPAHRYAVFTLRGAEITGSQEEAIRTQLIESGLHPDARYGYQRYDTRFKGMDSIDESELDFYYPLLP